MLELAINWPIHRNIDLRADHSKACTLYIGKNLVRCCLPSELFRVLTINCCSSLDPTDTRWEYGLSFLQAAWASYQELASVWNV